MKCEDPTHAKLKNHDIGFYDVEFRCGKCPACRLMKRAEKVCRMILECQAHEEAAFLTLTYDEANLPYTTDTWEPTLDKEDAKKFIKRLRRHFEYHFGRKLRLFLCGEYGGQTGRPHYHAIVWGAGTGYEEVFNGCWNNGLIHVGTVTPASMAYVAWYTTKESKFGFHTGSAVVPEFNIQPRKPGMGFYAIPFLAAAARDLYAKEVRYQESISPTEFYKVSSDLSVSQNFAIIRLQNVYYPIDRYIRNKLYETLKEENEDIAHELAKKHKALASHQKNQKWGFEYVFDEMDRQTDQRRANAKITTAHKNREKNH